MTKEPAEFAVQDRPLVCQHCRGRLFFERTASIHGAASSFFDTEWLFGQTVVCFTCSACGHMHWFMPTE
jgi:RNase P subunit RPR2